VSAVARTLAADLEPAAHRRRGEPVGGGRGVAIRTALREVGEPPRVLLERPEPAVEVRRERRGELDADVARREERGHDERGVRHVGARPEAGGVGPCAVGLPRREQPRDVPPHRADVAPLPFERLGLREGVGREREPPDVADGRERRERPLDERPVAVALDPRPVPGAEEGAHRESGHRPVERARDLLAVRPPPEAVARGARRDAARGEAVGVPRAVGGGVAREPVEPGRDRTLARGVAAERRERRGARRAGPRTEEARDGPWIPGGVIRVVGPAGRGAGQRRGGGSVGGAERRRDRGDERRHRPQDCELADEAHPAIVREASERRATERGSSERPAAERGCGPGDVGATSIARRTVPRRPGLIRGPA